MKVMTLSNDKFTELKLNIQCISILSCSIFMWCVIQCSIEKNSKNWLLVPTPKKKVGSWYNFVGLLHVESLCAFRKRVQELSGLIRNFFIRHKLIKAQSSFDFWHYIYLPCKIYNVHVILINLFINIQIQAWLHVHT